jgi:hypothetical protein
VDETLNTAKLGLSDLLDPSKIRWRVGLRNLIVFGRSVTFVLQNLRGIQSIDFDRWYSPHQASMKADSLMRYFVDARNELEKQGKLSVVTNTYIKYLSHEEMQKLGPPPAGARNFFIGDEVGGCGWEFELADGRTAKYYVDLPTSIGEVKQEFTNFPIPDTAEFAGKTVEDLCVMYLQKLEELVLAAKKHFLKETIQQQLVRTRTHLRLVK